MEPVSDSSAENQGALLLADYDRWLDFAMACRLTTRHYDQHLSRIKRHSPHLEILSNYLRDCMRQRASFFGRLATMLTKSIEQLRIDPANKDLIRRLTHAHPVMEALIQQLTVAFAEIEESYRTLPMLQSSGNSDMPNY